jgi:hypothetical protein
LHKPSDAGKPTTPAQGSASDFAFDANKDMPAFDHWLHLVYSSVLPSMTIQ